MFVAFATFVLFVAVCGAAPNADLNLKDHHKWTKITDGVTQVREKRSPLSIFAQGANALRKLLKQTTGIGHDQKYRNFIKHGDYETALKEFKSVSPVDVRTTTTDRGVKIVTGFIGNKKLKLRSPGYKYNSDAVLDVIDFTAPDRGNGRPYIDSIIYSKNVKPKN